MPSSSGFFACLRIGGKNALRVQPTQVLTIGVERMKDVMEQRAIAMLVKTLYGSKYAGDVLHLCPFGHVALDTSLYGTANPHAGQLSSRSFVCSPEGSCCPRSVALLASVCAESEREGGAPGRRHWMMTRYMKGRSSSG